MRRIPDPLGVAARRFPERPALIGPRATITYRELRDRVRALRGVLRDRGVRSGDRVAALLDRSVDCAALLHSVMRIPSVAAPLSTRWPANRTRRALDRLRPAALLTDREKPSGAPPGTRNGPATLRLEDLSSGLPARPLPEHLDLDRPVTILHTSGSTGRPRAVVHTLGAHYFSARGANTHLPLASGDRWLLSLPLYHVGGLAVLFRTLLAGAAAVVPETESSLETTLRARRITHCSLVPTQLHRMLAENVRPPRSLRTVLVGGGPTSRSLLRRARTTGWPVYLTYGATETASQVTTAPEPSDPSAPLTSGTVLPYRRVRIAEDGEIVVGGRTLLTGYLGEEGPRSPLEAGGWFPTGDRGEWTERDELRVLGRADDRFVSGGENVHPREIERALEALAPVDAALVVPVPHEEYGARPAAFVRWTGKPVSRSEIRKLLAPELARFKHPDRLLPWPEELPGSEEATGTIDREALARRARETIRSNAPEEIDPHEADGPNAPDGRGEQDPPREAGPTG